VDGAGRGHVPIGQLVGGIGARDVLHRNPQLAALSLSASVNRHHVGVVQLSGDVGLAFKTGPENVVAR
jgi:hypothetical protein